MEKTSIKITRYKSGKFFVDIHEKKDGYSAWLTRNLYGISTLMFGFDKKDMDYDTFCAIVEANLDEYKKTYDLECGEWEEAHA